jgi:DNA-binding PadR family transcriptional regulator
MSVRQSLLAILEQDPCYGYQLRQEFERRTGSTWPLNVGQIYNTLDRLERDGLVVKDDIDSEGHVYYAITDAGRTEVAEWVDGAVPRSRDELATKIALVGTLPDRDPADVIRAQRHAVHAEVRQLSELGEPDGPEDLARFLVIDAAIARAEAELAWLDRTESRLARMRAEGLTTTIARDDSPARRGRPPLDPR